MVPGFCFSWSVSVHVIVGLSFKKTEANSTFTLIQLMTYDATISFPGEDISQMSHPPHLTSSWSSALIPFCAYKMDLKIFKECHTLPNITFPLCSSFLPTILEGQLCYKLNLNMTSGQRKKNELMLILDYNEERSL